MNKIPNAKMKKAKQALARLREKYNNGLNSRPAQGPTDTVFQEFVSKLDNEDVETRLEGIAELGDIESTPKP